MDICHPSIFEQRHVQLLTACVPLIYFGTIKWHQMDHVIPQFGGLQDIPGLPLNIDFLHSKDGREGDRWFPYTYNGMGSRSGSIKVVSAMVVYGREDILVRGCSASGLEDDAGFDGG
ncbi:hypothetical protein PIB30_049664 [Stylosanthes scabra]|uniref:Uncharacterized protein n=1 Tax=Stylosanthes scabra TaxID=79078 RepID=A0ABU6TI80_9FABA|nr:hypothetical protein [Stylosanthes scabra]